MRVWMLALLVCTVPSLALAQDPPASRRGPEIVIHPRPHPHPFVLLRRATVRFDRADAEHHAVDRIVDSVTHAPF